MGVKTSKPMVTHSVGYYDKQLKDHLYENRNLPLKEAYEKYTLWSTKTYPTMTVIGEKYFEGMRYDTVYR